MQVNHIRRTARPRRHLETYDLPTTGTSALRSTPFAVTGLPAPTQFAMRYALRSAMHPGQRQDRLVLR